MFFVCSRWAAGSAGNHGEAAPSLRGETTGGALAQAWRVGRGRCSNRAVAALQQEGRVQSLLLTIGCSVRRWLLIVYKLGSEDSDSKADGLCGARSGSRNKLE